ncbi:MAG: trypsin-like peptidase domain-containing protein [Gemmobacter sp.]
MPNTAPSRPLPALLRPMLRVFGAMFLLTLLAALPPAHASGAPLDRAMASVLVVRSAGTDDRFLGSAFVWAGGEVAVTNAHVTGDAPEVRLVARDGNTQIAPVIARDRVRDVAVIGLAPGGAAGLAPGPVPTLGDPVWALGAPLGLEFTATRGIVSASARQVEQAVPLRLLQHDAAVNPGSSGGPLIDAAGRVVGMNSRIADGSRHYVGVSYAIAAPDLARIVEGLVAETLPDFPALGLHLRPVTRQIAAALGITAQGALVDRVEPGTPAARAGLRAGDILLRADGAPIATPGDLAFAVEAGLTRGSLSLTVIRDGVVTEILLPLDPPAEAALGMREIGAVARVTGYHLAALGLTVEDRDGCLTVAQLTESSPALLAGLAPGDRILAVNGAPLDLASARALTIRAAALVLVERPGGATRHVILDPWDRGAAFRPQGGANVLDPSVAVF